MSRGCSTASDDAAVDSVVVAEERSALAKGPSRGGSTEGIALAPNGNGAGRWGIDARCLLCRVDAYDAVAA